MSMISDGKLIWENDNKQSKIKEDILSVLYIVVT
jgi:hypothetical protein